MRELTALQRVLVLSPVLVGTTGFALERFDCDGFEEHERCARTFADFFVNAPARYAWYNAVSPEGWQRNRVIDARELMSSDDLEASAINIEVLAPNGLTRSHQPRALLCEGATLLGWFGAFHDAAPDARARSLLGRLLRPFHRRLAVERRIAELSRQQSALRTGLEVLGAAALTVDMHGRIHDANLSARALLASRRIELRTSIEAARHGGRGVFDVELIPIAEPGVPNVSLVLLRESSTTHTQARAAHAAALWCLSRRQQEVLTHVVDGASNVTIALTLGVSLRAVEQHVSALLVKADVETRAALVAKVLAPSENRSIAAAPGTETGL